MRNWTELKGIGWKIVDAVLMGILVVLSADILYLYYSGAWYDPIILIEISEVALLYLFSIVGTVRIILKLLELKKHFSISN